jgi:hypothetical protein
MMRVLASLFVVAALLIPLQSANDFELRYGRPDIERFVARPGIGLTVQYDSDGEACQMVLEPPQSIIHKEEPTKYMSPDLVNEILEELVPLRSRGGEGLIMITSMGCNEFRSTDYLNVTITHSWHNCLPLQPDREMRTTVVLKRKACQDLSK